MDKSDPRPTCPLSCEGGRTKSAFGFTIRCPHCSPLGVAGKLDPRTDKPVHHGAQPIWIAVDPAGDRDYTVAVLQ